jgi:hypothetical protein
MLLQHNFIDICAVRDRALTYSYGTSLGTADLPKYSAGSM